MQKSALLDAIQQEIHEGVIWMPVYYYYS